MLSRFALAALAQPGDPRPAGRNRTAGGGFAVGVLAAALLFSTGCRSIDYYRQAALGQLEILRAQRPVSGILGDTTAPDDLRHRLRLALEAREFARDQLGLDPDGHYLRYADLRRRFVVWTVHAAPPFSFEPRTWCYPIVGRLEYRGYFSEASASDHAARLAARGYETHVGGVEAYSTLGWLRDPILNTFLANEESELVELLFHELTHVHLFVSGDTDFSEAFATATAEEGLNRWMQAKQDVRAQQEYQASLRRKREFIALVAGARAQLETLYESVDGTSLTCPIPPELREKKQRILDQLRADYRQLKARWGGASEYDGWMNGPLNNAQLNTLDTYYRLVPAFREILRRKGGSLPDYYAEVARISRLPRKVRHATLERLLHGAAAEGGSS